MVGKKNKNYSKTTLKLLKNKKKFYCNCCDYLSFNNSNYNKHLRTKKHLEKKGVFAKTSKPLVSSNIQFFCEICDYSTSRRSNWVRHIQSIKHFKNEQKTSNSDDALPTLEDFNNLLDELQTLKSEKEAQKGVFSPKNGNSEQNFHQNSNNSNLDMELIKNQINKIIENQNEIKEEAKKGGTTINNYNNISITLFLDNYCNNAKSVQDFLKNVSFELKDIVSNNSLIEDFLSKKVIKNLQDLPITERPIHCTDNKRKNFMVKDATSGWVKDDGTDASGSLYNKMNSLQNKAYIDFFNEYDKENPLPHDTEKERIKCKVSRDMLTNKDKNNKNAIIDIANSMLIKEAIENSVQNNKIIK